MSKAANRKAETMSGAAKRWLAVWLISIAAAGGLLYAGVFSVTAEQRAAVASSRPAQLPLSFEPQGAPGRFLAHGAGYSLSLAAEGATLGMRYAVCRTRVDCREKRAQAQSAVLNWSLVNANPQAQGVGLDLLPGRSNYLIGRDPRRWRTNVPNYGQARFRGVYPGIDVLYYGNQGRLEYDFKLAPHADPRAIVLEFSGAERLEVDREGNLVIHLGGQSIVQRKPFAYQTAPDGTGRPVSVNYVVSGTTRVAFEVAPYDTTQPLTIDPVLVYSTYFGGSNADQATATAVEYNSAKAYFTGITTSPNLAISNGVPSSLRGASDIFVTKLNAGGTAVEYSTYIGGDGSDEGLSLAIDAAGNAYITGTTDSANFPTTSGSFRTTLAGERDAFVLKLNANGDALVYSTYLGGSAADDGYGLALDLNNNAYVTGITDSDNFPTTSGAFQLNKSSLSDAFITKLNADGSALAYSSYLGGGGIDWSFGVATDFSGNAYLAGLTSSNNFPTTSGVVQSTLGGASDCFVAKINPNESGAASLKYATYLGGSDADWGFTVAVDSIGHAYVSGLTNSKNFPMTRGSLQTVKRNSSDAFIAKLSGAGTTLNYSTYFGGDGADYALSISTDSAGQVFVSGSTQSTNFPVSASASQPSFGGSSDAFAIKLNFSGSGLISSTYLGGSKDEEGFAIAHAIASRVFVAGGTNSANFPLVAPVQAAAGGGGDAFISRLADNSGLTPLEEARFFVRQHYLDFLNRDPDKGGWDYWTNEITQCGTNQECIRRRRTGVSNAFFYEAEFQNTGAFVYRLYKAAYGDTAAYRPTYAQFMPDRARIDERAAFMAQSLQDLSNAFVQRPEFIARYPSNLTGAQFVAAILGTIQAGSGANLQSQRDALIGEFDAGGRGRVMYHLADDTMQNPINNRVFVDAEYNRSFVLTQYFGFLRRNPDQGGYDFWLEIINHFPLRDSHGQNAMVCAFITSKEYQERFGSLAPRNNQECSSAP